MELNYFSAILYVIAASIFHQDIPGVWGGGRKTWYCRTCPYFDVRLYIMWLLYVHIPESTQKFFYGLNLKENSRQ